MKIALTIISLITLAIAIIAGLYGYNGILWVGFFSFALLLLVAHINQFEEFKATSTGIHAKTRDVIEKAEVTVSELQSLAKLTASITLSNVKRAGRLGGYGDDEQERIKKSVFDVLTKIGVTESDSEMVLSDWHRFTKFDYVMAIIGGNQVPQGFKDRNIQIEWDALRDLENPPSPEQLSNFLKKWELLDEAHKEYIADYKYYIENGQHRRPKEWRKRDSWGKLKKQ